MVTVARAGVALVASGASIIGGGVRRGFGLSLEVMLTRLPMEVIRFLTLEKVRLRALRDFMANGREYVAMFA